MNPIAFNEWLSTLRGEAYVVANHVSTPNYAVVWSEDEIDIHDDVTVEIHTEASGDAPAVRDRDVAGWNKYELSIR